MRTSARVVFLFLLSALSATLMGPLAAQSTADAPKTTGVLTVTYYYVPG